MPVKRLAIAIAAFLAVVAVAAGFLLLRAPRPGPAAPRPSAPTPAAGNVNASATPVLTPDDIAACDSIADAGKRQDCKKIGYRQWSRAEEEAAHASGDPARCEKLNDAAHRDSCRTYFTEGSHSSDNCRKLEDAGQREWCQITAVSLGDDLPACDAFSTDEKREICRKALLLEHRDAGVAFCDRYDAAHQAVCLVWYWKNQALVQYDSRVCKNIADPAEVERCRALLPPDTDGDGFTDRDEQQSYFTDPKKADTDGDGLSDFDEIRVYKTDPKKADTDGDGFSDGQEVKNGFNPNGPGKLAR